jgi:hypothetical protein
MELDAKLSGRVGSGVAGGGIYPESYRGAINKLPRALRNPTLRKVREGWGTRMLCWCQGDPQVVKIFLYRNSLRNFPCGSYFLLSSMNPGILV